MFVLIAAIALRMSYSMKNYYPPEDKNYYDCLFTHQYSFAKVTSGKPVCMKAKQKNQHLSFIAILLL